MADAHLTSRYALVMVSLAKKQIVVGRYAPSPTGDLHLGNLRTALIAWLQARVAGGQFLMRMEDVDTPRVVPGSDKNILEDLEWLGLDWDGAVVYQSKRQSLYRDVLNDLSNRGLTYPCFCSRKDIRQAASAPHATLGVYPGTCANLDPVQINELLGLKQAAVRVRVSSALQASCGDFVLRRADGLFAYQLAVVVDDLQQGITDVVRGEDLADSTARQLFLARVINNDAPMLAYHHVPLLMDEHDKRMSKRDGSFSARQWRDGGGSPDALIGKFAWSLKLVENDQPISAMELLSDVTIEQLQRVFIST